MFLNNTVRLHARIAYLSRAPRSCIRTSRCSQNRHRGNVKLLQSKEGQQRSLKLFYRDGLELFKFLFANPLFVDHFQAVPSKVWADFDKEVQLFSEEMEGELAWKLQVRV